MWKFNLNLKPVLETYRKQMLLPLGAWVGDWRVQRLLGRGTYSKV